MKLAVLGAGAWGTALAVALAGRHDIRLWGRDPAHMRDIGAARRNLRYLPDCPLPSTVAVGSDLAAAVGGADLILAAVPTSALRETIVHLRHVRTDCPLIWTCKGFEAGTALLPDAVVDAEYPPGAPRGVLSGPSFAREIASGLPAALTLASSDAAFAGDSARALHGGRLRVYSSRDVAGVQLGGALKNVMAIAAGMSDGMALGDNARAALITRGLAEITRLGVRMGGRPETFMGLTGLGDLVLTCAGALSRNRRVGMELGRGDALADILPRLGHVAEGVMTAREAARLAAGLNMDMPITQAVCAVLDGRLSPAAALQELLSRDPKPESSQD